MVEEREWIRLSNNVEKLKKGNEKDGLGKFLYDKLEWKVEDAQLASQIGAIFTLSRAWKYNGQKKGIQFKKNNVDWKKSIMAYFIDELSDEA